MSATPSSVVLPTSKKASGVVTSLSLHPLPILNISEHLVRTHLQTSRDDAPEHSSDGVKVFGALLGTQSGSDIEVHNTFEFKVSHADRRGEAGPSSPPQVDHAFLKSRQAQFKQVFPTFDFLGWYSNGSAPSETDMEVHKQLLEYNEAPLFLQISPSDSSLAASSKAGELPVQLYESQMELAPHASTQSADTTTSASSGVQMYFVRSSYSIQTGEAERIAVDYTARPSDSGAEGDAGNAIAALTTQQSAIRMLYERIQIAKQYVTAVRNGTAPRDHETLRKIKSVLASMPAMDSNEFKEEFLREYNDVMLTSYLSSLTKGLNGLNELVDKFDLVAGTFDDRREGGAVAGPGGGGTGGFGASTKDRRRR